MTRSAPATVVSGAPERAARQLRSILHGEVRMDRLSRALYATDAGIHEIVPAGVVLPRTVEDVVATVRTCREFGLTVVPRGAGTGLSGGAVGPGMQIDFSRFLHAIGAVDAERQTVDVEPGVVLDDLNQHLAPHALQFAPDVAPSSRATLGGMIANNSCGAHSVVYGRTVDHVRSLTVVLASGSVVKFHRPSNGHRESDLHRTGGSAGHPAEDSLNEAGSRDPFERALTELRDRYAGEIDRRFPKILRSNGGYGLDRLGPPGMPASAIPVLCGSEGTLGLVVRATLDLVPAVPHKGLLVLHYADMLEALSSSPAILTHGPAAVELIDRPLIEGGLRNAAIARRCQFLRGEPDALLVVEFFGATADEVRERIERLARDAEAIGAASAAVRVMERSGQTDVWNLRKSGLGLLMSHPGNVQPQAFIEDSAVDPARLRDYVARLKSILDREGLSASFYGHSSVGCLHVRPAINLSEAPDVERMRRIAGEVAELAVEFGGTMTGEHGDGIVRSGWLQILYGPRILDAFREVKRIFDPDGVMNPGKIVDPFPMTENLRSSGRPASPPVRTALDFDAYGGMGGLAGMCSGVGQCRQRFTGTMCPSFMATRDETHSTRARANALRHALSDHGILGGLHDEALDDVLDLCLSCKACKTECPTGVDMARLKSEYLHQRILRKGADPAARLIAGFPKRLASASRWPSLYNLIAGSKLVRSWMEAWFGLDGRFPPPRLAPRTFRQWFRRHVRSRLPVGAPRGTVVYFVDTWTNFLHPEVGVATVRILEHLGFEVLCPATVCCGRPSISKGLLAEAAQAAETNIGILAPYARRGLSIVGSEPSCILSFVDEYPQLVPGRLARTVAERVCTAESFLAGLIRGDPSVLGPRLSGVSLRYHAHCHQKALVGTDDAETLIRHFWPNAGSLISAGCCGMAGSFGHEKAHYEIAKAVGEERLFPAVRARGDAAIAVSGFSCREQIAHHTDARPRHLMEYLADAVGLTSAP